MIRDGATTEIFRGVAKKASGEHASGAPNARSFLRELAGNIIDDEASTGDELIDALVAWYEGSLTRQTIDRFDRLDRSLGEMVGQSLLVVQRFSSKGKPHAVTATYDMGRVSEDGLVCNLMAGRSYVPVNGHVRVSGFRGLERDERPVEVTEIFSCGWDDEYRFLHYGYPNLAKDFTVDGRTKEAFRPDDYVSPLDASESRQPPIQVFLGDEVVAEFLYADTAASRQFARLDAIGVLVEEGYL